jgi:hypothetical protein
MACRQNPRSQHSPQPSFSQQRSLRRRQSQSPSRPHGTNPIGTARVSGFAQSGFNEVAHGAKIRAQRRATSQKPPDSQSGFGVIHGASDQRREPMPDAEEEAACEAAL